MLLVSTLLKGAKEVGDKWKPDNAREIAKEHKEKVKKNAVERRKGHERVS